MKYSFLYVVLIVVFVWTYIAGNPDPKTTEWKDKYYDSGTRSLAGGITFITFLVIVSWLYRNYKRELYYECKDS